jgi:hypothetical protein
MKHKKGDIVKILRRNSKNSTIEVEIKVINDDFYIGTNNTFLTFIFNDSDIVEPAIEKTYKIGDQFKRYVLGNYNSTLLLAMAGPGDVCLIDMKDGNRIIDPIRVVHHAKITQKEFSLMHNNYILEKIN